MNNKTNTTKVVPVIGDTLSHRSGDKNPEKVIAVYADHGIKTVDFYRFEQIKKIGEFTTPVYDTATGGTTMVPHTKWAANCGQSDGCCQKQQQRR
jgi:hypothetical protein